ncbi:hypothetical protein NA57DRAFT_70349 [Rhizodiscina lignyota]|uniref:Uncharacterized protein n=1 Tax=Rhizodiscina lignyota TaxID=1504668 RepID=A0A9P4IM93_9PEZI|nr:hypothetical protein NA57DRAFT_70349 [Rhizodiscina lignyota]
MATGAINGVQASRFLALPSELRDLIYEHVFEPSSFYYPLADQEGYFGYDFSTFAALQRTCRVVASESKPIFHKLNRFVRVRTPWPEAQHHIEHEGRVPILKREEKALAFKIWSVDIVINAPDLALVDDTTFCKFIIHAQDLDGFARMWFYSDLSHPGLNGHLRLSLIFRDPFPTVDKETGQQKSRSMPKQSQREIMMPFGRVKGLQDANADGLYDQSIFKELQAEMDVPLASAEDCLEQTTKKKEAGDSALQKKDYSRAIDLYEQAFAEMHIPCKGRRRNIYGDAWFVKTLESGRYDGQQGHLVRLVLRVQLVAAVVDCYLGLEDWDTAKFWGMRSINLMREANGDDDGEAEDEPMLGFPGADAVGLLYFRTAKALRMLGDRDEARRLMKTALAYLPSNEEVRKEWEGLRLQRIGGYGWIG